MELNEATARAVNRYFKRLVKNQPFWLRELFDENRIVFLIDPHGTLDMEVDAGLPESLKGKAQALIGKYIRRHPAPFMREMEVQ